MKKGKTALFVILFIVALCVLFYFVPMSKIIGRLPYINKFYNNTSIEIVTQNCTAKITINNKEYGETPLTVEDLPEGEYTIELERVTTESAFYNKESFTIELSKNTSARIDIEIGPDDIMHGTVLYYTPVKMSTDNEGYITITSNAENANIYINNEFTKKSSVSNLELKEDEYNIKITADGYEDITIPVLVRKGYLLNLKTYQYPIPVILENTSNE